MKEMRSVPEGRGLLALGLERKASGCLSGWFRMESSGKVFRFSGLSAMAMLVEELLDLPEAEIPQQEDVPAGNADFEVEILFRQSYSWQGRVRRVGSAQWTAYHSTLELLILLESAVTE